MRTWPDGLGITTMPEHHGDGLLTGDITPIDSIYVNSSCTLVHNGSGTFLYSYNKNYYEVKMVWFLPSTGFHTPLQDFQVLETNEGKAF